MLVLIARNSLRFDRETRFIFAVLNVIRVDWRVQRIFLIEKRCCHKENNHNCDHCPTLKITATTRSTLQYTLIKRVVSDSSHYDGGTSAAICMSTSEKKSHNHFSITRFLFLLQLNGDCSNGSVESDESASPASVASPAAGLGGNTSGGHPEAATMTEPESLGHCEPGTAVKVSGIVWNETEKGLLMLNVTWKGKTYVGTLLDCHIPLEEHKWGPPG